jgi:hypothetical protein
MQIRNRKVVGFITNKEIEIETYTNHFMPGLFGIKLDYCEIANQTLAAAKFAINVMD